MLRARHSQKFWWVAPGGGLVHGETFEAAAHRELYEETGLRLAIGPCVWTRLHRYDWGDRACVPYERFSIAAASDSKLAPAQSDSYIVGHHWCSLEEIQRSEDFVPRRLGELLPAIVRGEYPNPPTDCGE